MKKHIIIIGILVNLILDVNITYAVDVNNFKDISIVNSKVGYGIDDKGILLKSINGKWETVSISSDVKQSEWEFCGIDFVNDTLGWVIGNNKEGKGIIMKTVNGGQNWITLFPKVRGKEVPLYCISFANARIGYIGAGNGNLLKTTDGGINWIETVSKSISPTSQYSSDCIKSIWVDKTDPNFVWATMGNDSWVAMTRDGGCSWRVSSQMRKGEDFRSLMIMIKKNSDWIKPLVVKNK
jgi:photosystem II stability/assembly factor-like uncharacterized protein